MKRYDYFRITVDILKIFDIFNTYLNIYTMICRKAAFAYLALLIIMVSTIEIPIRKFPQCMILEQA